MKTLPRLLPIALCILSWLATQTLSPSVYRAAEIPDSVINPQEILPDNPEIYYSGRLDWQDPQAPSLGFPGTTIEFQFQGTNLAIELTEDNWNTGNYIDVYLDNQPSPKTIQLEPNLLQQSAVYQLAEGLENKVHRVQIVKRTDYITGEFKFHRLMTDGKLVPSQLTPRKMEVYGDSISAGSIVEHPQAGVPDPEDNHNALSNAYWSYAAILAREYDAQLSLVAQSGASLVDGYGYWHNGTGMEAFFNKVKPLEDAPYWDFAQYTPDLVIIALGQNDSATIEIGKDMSAQEWKQHYQQLIDTLRANYPDTYIIGMFPNMYHDRQWDSYLTEAIAEYRSQHNDQRIFSLIHPQVTPGHPRISEQQQMANSLKQLIDGTLTDNGFSWAS